MHKEVAKSLVAKLVGTSWCSTKETSRVQISLPQLLNYYKEVKWHKVANSF